MTLREAERQLEGAALVPYAQTSLAYAKEILDVCLRADIPAVLGRDPSCEKGGCAPRVQILMREEDLPRAAALLERLWTEMAAREGTLFELPSVDPDGNLPCPACGSPAELQDGACPDCGLVLE